MRYRKYTIEQLVEEALKYNSRQAFKKGSPREYKAAHNYGEIGTVTKHMVTKHPRICSKCSTPNKLEDFTKNSKCVEGHTHTCKVCHNLKQSKQAAVNPNTKKNRRDSARRVKERIRAKLLEYHGGALICADCKFTSEIYSIFDYHHIDSSTKEHTISSILDHKWDTVKEEVDKCVLLCANCHRVRHYKENNVEEQTHEKDS